MKGDGIEDGGRDSGFGEPLADAIAIANADDVLMKDVPPADGDRRKNDPAGDFGVPEHLRVTAGDRDAPGRPPLEIRELREKHGGLEGIHPEVPADARVMVALRFAVEP